METRHQKTQLCAVSASEPGEYKVRLSKWKYFCTIRNTGRVGLKSIGQKTKQNTKVECQSPVDKCELCIYIVLLVFLCFVFVVDVNNIVLMLLLGQPKK